MKFGDGVRGIECRGLFSVDLTSGPIVALIVGSMFPITNVSRMSRAFVTVENRGTIRTWGGIRFFPYSYPQLFHTIKRRLGHLWQGSIRHEHQIAT